MLRLTAGEYVLDRRLSLPADMAVKLISNDTHGSAEACDDAPAQATVIRGPANVEPGPSRDSAALTLFGDHSELCSLTMIMQGSKIDVAVRLMDKRQTVRDAEVVHTEGWQVLGVCGEQGGRQRRSRGARPAGGGGRQGGGDRRRHRLPPRGRRRVPRRPWQRAGYRRQRDCPPRRDSFIFERNDIASLDWDGGRVFTRAILLIDGGMDGGYVAENNIRRVGPQLRIPGIDPNTGEIILFHHAGPKEVRLDAVVDTGTTPSDDWMVVVTSGQGREQWRRLRSMDGDRLKLDTPWRVVPEAGDECVVQRGFTAQAVYGNRIDIGVPDVQLRLVGKTEGVSLYYNAVGNVIACNSIIDTTVGCKLWARPGHVAAWNEFRDNLITKVGRYTGSVRIDPTVYHEAVQVRVPKPDVMQLALLGNAFRRNGCGFAEVGVRLG